MDSHGAWRKSRQTLWMFFFRHVPVTQLIEYCGSTYMLSGRRTDVLRWTQSEDEGTTTTQALCRILRLIYKRYLTSFPLILDRVGSLSVFEKLRSSTQTQHRRSCSLNVATTYKYLASTVTKRQQPRQKSRFDFVRPLPRSDDCANDYGTNTTLSL